MEIAFSINHVPIRLTNERWMHIIENHDDLAGKYHAVLDAVAHPDAVIEGMAGELFAIQYERPRSLIVIYKEISRSDGFIITSFETSKINQVLKSRKLLWQKSL